MKRSEETDLVGHDIKAVKSCPYCEKYGHLRLVCIIGKQTGLLHRIFMSVAHQQVNEETGIHFCGNQYLNIYEAVRICRAVETDMKRLRAKGIEDRIRYILTNGGRTRDMELMIHAMDKIRDGFPLEAIHEEILNKTCDININYRIHGKIRKNNFELMLNAGKA